MLHVPVQDKIGLQKDGTKLICSLYTVCWEINLLLQCCIQDFKSGGLLDVQNHDLCIQIDALAQILWVQNQSLRPRMQGRALDTSLLVLYFLYIFQPLEF